MRDRLPLLAAFAASLYPFVAFWTVSPDRPLAVLAVLPFAALLAIALCCLVVRVVGAPRAVGTVAAAWVLLALWIDGPAAAFSFALSAATAVALGARLMLRADALTPIERAVLAYLVGLALLITALSLVLAWPVHFPAVYTLACLAIVGWQRRALLALLGELGGQWRAWRAAPPSVLSGGLALAASLLWVWGAWGGFLPILAFDDLGLHLRLPYELLVRHRYSFGVGEHVWAASPWAADLAFAIPFVISQGSEGVKAWVAGSYHFASAVLLFGLLARRIPRPAALLFLLAQLAIPMVMASLYTLHTEGLSSALVLAVFAFWAIQRDRLARGPALAACLLLAFLGAIKASNLAASLLLGLLWLPWLLRQPRRWWPVLLAALATLLVPYVIAWTRTGNPVLPLFNAVFRSPYFPPTNLSNHVYEGMFNSDLYESLFLHGTRHLETMTDIVAGPALFLLLPPGLVLLAWRADLERRCAMVVALLFALLLLSSQQYVRYLFPVAALMLFALSRVWDAAAGPRMERTWHGWCATLLLVAVGTGVVAMPRAFWQTRTDVLASAVRPDSAIEAVRAFAPERELNRTANAELGVHARVLYTAEPFGADLYGTPIYANPYNIRTEAAARAVRDEAGAAAFVRQFALTHMMLSDPAARPPLGKQAQQALESFARGHGRIVATSGNASLLAFDEDLVWSRPLWTLEPAKAGSRMSAGAYLWGSAPTEPGALVQVELDGVCGSLAARPAVEMIWTRNGEQVRASTRIEPCLPRADRPQGAFSIRERVEAPSNADRLLLRLGGATREPVQLMAASIRGLANHERAAAVGLPSW